MEIRSKLWDQGRSEGRQPFSDSVLMTCVQKTDEHFLLVAIGGCRDLWNRACPKTTIQLYRYQSGHIHLAWLPYRSFGRLPSRIHRRRDTYGQLRKSPLRTREDARRSCLGGKGWAKSPCCWTRKCRKDEPCEIAHFICHKIRSSAYCCKSGHQGKHVEPSRESVRNNTHFYTRCRGRLGKQPNEWTKPSARQAASCIFLRHGESRRKHLGF